jgi:sestrin
LFHSSFAFWRAQKLTRGQDNWSISELMHAVVILAHFHALCSFIYGCGINAELDMTDDLAPTVASSASTSPATPGTSPGVVNGSGSVEEGGGGGIEALMERMRKLTEEAQEEMTQEELQKRFERIETQTSERKSFKIFWVHFVAEI